MDLRYIYDLKNQYFQKYKTFEIDINKIYDIQKSICLYNDCFNIRAFTENEVFIYFIQANIKCNIKLKIFRDTSLDMFPNVKLCILNTSRIECPTSNIYLDENYYYIYDIKDFSDEVRIFL